MEYNILRNRVSYVTEKTIPSIFARTFPSVYGYPQIGKELIVCAAKVKHRSVEEAWPIILHHAAKIVTVFEHIGSVVYLENLHYTQQATPVIILANHMSSLETIATTLFAGITRGVSFVSKQSVMRYPVFKHIFAKLYPVLVGRENPREDFKIVLKQCAHLLEMGRNIVIFPQGTRDKYCRDSSFSSIGVKLAKATGAPIVPLALKTDAWGVGKYVRNMGYLRPLPIRYTFFEPIFVRSATGKEEHALSVRIITEQVQQWHEMDNTL